MGFVFPSFAFVAFGVFQIITPLPTDEVQLREGRVRDLRGSHLQPTRPAPAWRCRSPCVVSSSPINSALHLDGRRDTSRSTSRGPSGDGQEQRRDLVGGGEGLLGQPLQAGGLVNVGRRMPVTGAVRSSARSTPDRYRFWRSWMWPSRTETPGVNRTASR